MLKSVPPSLARIKITSPTTSLESITKLGLTAEDLKPVDWRKKANIQPPKNQEQCGNCWAMSSTGALTDKFIIGNGLDGLNLDPTVLTQCVPDVLNNGCCGGVPSTAATYMESFGLPQVSSDYQDISAFASTMNCSGNETTGLPTCQQLLSPQTKVPIFKALPETTVSAVVQGKTGAVQGEETIINMKNALNKGPFVSSFFVPFEFEFAATAFPHGEQFWPRTNGILVLGQHDDIYDKYCQDHNIDKTALFAKVQVNKWSDIVGTTANNPAALGAHAVETVGWDEDSKTGLEYWIVKNSWGTDWGEGGYFKIAMNSAKNKNPNASLGFDVPTQTSQGLFGGATFFEADLNSGVPPGNKPNPGPQPQPQPKTDSKSSSSHYLLYIGIGVAVLTVLIVAYILYMRIGKRYRYREMSSTSSEF